MKLLKFTPYIILFFFLSCKSSKTQENNQLSFPAGFFVVCEGNYTANNGSISFYNTENKTVTNNIFALQNQNIPLGDVVQSACQGDDKLFIAVNNSKKIEVVNRNTFKSEGTIKGVEYPRYMCFYNNKLYVSDGFTNGNLVIIDAKTLHILNKIPISSYPENIILKNNKIFIACGAWGKGNKIVVYNPENETIENTFEVGVGVTDIAQGQANTLWALCAGNADLGEQPKLININASTGEILKSTIISSTNQGFQPLRLAVSPDFKTAYFAGKQGIYRTDKNQKIENTPFILGSFYGLEVNPITGNIYCFSDAGFVAQGKLSIYSPNGTNLINNLSVGIGPNGGIFSN